MVTDKIGFTITTWKDAPNAMWALGLVRTHYPQASILSIADGLDAGEEYKEYCKEHNIEYVLGEFLKTPEDAGKWIHRWMEMSLEYHKDADIIIKIDPDTALHRPIHRIPNAEAFGNIRMAMSTKTMVIESNSLGITREALARIVESKYLLDKRYVNRSPLYNSKLQRERVVMTDWILYNAMSRLNIKLAQWTEVLCGNDRYLPNPNLLYAFTHPNVEMKL